MNTVSGIAKSSLGLLSALAVVTAIVVADQAQAESRTFAYGTFGSAKYDGVGPRRIQRYFYSGYKPRHYNQRGLRLGKTKNYIRKRRK